MTATEGTSTNAREERRTEHVTALLKEGFIEVQEFGNLRVGSRVRHYGHQWDKAYSEGSGNVERIFHYPNSPWEKSWGRPNVEIIVKRDNGEDMFVADYHVKAMEVAA